ncbi:Flp family type IVb pilin [Nocardioides sp.]|uniref:Flp family type IVb pilin n=1 Tax=Nocardioides sp. TaxID=35761 RepID=UPI00271E5CDE|nr:hypothetical protein [Nocardioides sp.]MDO9454773.1 hypothetical protein [Nocardioides sp.]
MLNTQLARRQRDERGATAVEWVVITALVVGIATAVGVILLNLITGKANSISLD